MYTAHLKTVDTLDTLNMPHATPNPVIRAICTDHDLLLHSQHIGNSVVFLKRNYEINFDQTCFFTWTLTNEYQKNIINSRLMCVRLIFLDTF